ncbi:hypothetical protein SAMN05660860_03438 [Geoalkalibacter ferrihydriticus]|uniref:Uncharacterized protein n=1 Tax=Geoalkalibacter ferrihydriticus TaxID=392333 RepID=A0A1G9XCK8_9BACT|nr:hypothetical protein [Geoalkalibacter ferrihydriticus]SDM94025.1 hypothetical protein SAMN05660860_03438 [Geoalkalibacter ferrihydriticus]
MKRGAWSLVCIGLFLGALTLAAAVPGVMDGFAGIVISIFLLYCAIIVVAQLFSALYAMRLMVEDSLDKKRVSRRVDLN